MYTKYITTVQLMNDVLATNSIAELPHVVHPCHAAWDILFTFIHANFEKPETSCDLLDSASADVRTLEKQLCKDILFCKDHMLGIAITKIPPDIVDVVFPVAIASYLLRNNKLPFFKRRNLTTFDEFFDRYGFMVLGG